MGIRMTILILGVALALNGCAATTGEIENQAYALVLGVDRGANGGIDLTIRIPRIGQSGGGSGEQANKGAYLALSAGGDSYAQAMEHLQWAAARELNLSHLELIAVSAELAASADFPQLIDAIAETRHLYATAAFIVCANRAGDFIEGQETLLGAHLSSDIAAMFRHYAAHGYIPPSTFADLYYATRSCYSDPTGIWGFPDADEQPEDARDAAAVISDDPDGLNALTATASSRQYLGAALFREGRLAGHLVGSDTLYLNLLTRRVADFTYAFGGRACRFSSTRAPRRRVRVDADGVRIDAALWLAAGEHVDQAALELAERDIATTLTDFIRRCQQMGVEPFGFAERAAAHFPTFDAWRAYDWRSRFRTAEVTVQVHITSAS